MVTALVGSDAGTADGRRVLPVTPSTMRQCLRCGVAYNFTKSSSGLKLTYCGFMCEKSDLGSTIEDMLTPRS